MASSLSPADLGGFRSSFSGTLFGPNDDAYDAARGIWNGAIDRRPAAIARCSSTDQVVAAIRFARDKDLEISVRGGGHSFAGFSVCEGGLMIDLSGMRQVTVDPASRRAVAAGGATWGDLDAATQEHALAVTGGFISHTGIGGLTLGGGIGHLTRIAGLSCDNLVAAEVVTADGQILRAGPDDHADLFWALRGGGGNFGVVTSFEYRLHQIGPMVNFGLFFWPADRGAEALAFGREFVDNAAERTGVFLAALSAPPAPFVPEHLHLAPGYALVAVGYDSAEDFERAIKPIRDARPLFEFVTPMPYTMLQQAFDEGAPWGILGYEKALYLDDLSEGAIDVMVEHAHRRQSPLSFVPIFVLDGAYSRVGEGDTAFGGSRKARYGVNIAAVCPAPELLEADRGWVRAFWDALLPYSSQGSGSYINFMSEYDENRVRTSYGPAKYERLGRIKADYDPENVFHLNANIKPALQPA
jgi:FAD/FMN-containing dehydrogenase